MASDHRLIGLLNKIKETSHGSILEDILQVVHHEAERRLIEAAHDPQRPNYHFLPPPSWINDPIPYFYAGHYHVFSQYHPGVPYWGNMHWNHVVSEDLVHWKNLSMALFPTWGGPDSQGCWSGSVVEHEGLFYAFYTGVYPQQQCLAVSKDLINWEKHPHNPVVSFLQKPPDVGDTFRDPCVWKEKDGWYMLVGSTKPNLGGSPLLFRSSDLLKWEYLHPIYQGPAAGDECPDFFPLENKHVLISSRHFTKWAVGEFSNLKFEVERAGLVDHGAFYAANSLLDSFGRRIIFGWIREERPIEAQLTAGWSGVLSLPRVLSLFPNDKLRIEPVPELKVLRNKRLVKDSFELTGFFENVGLRQIEIPEANSIEIEIEFSNLSAREWGLVLPGGEDILYNVEQGRFMLEDYPLDDRKEFKIHIFVDNSVVEVFANDDFCKTVRVYRDLEAYDEPLRVICVDGKVRVKNLEVWSMGSIY